MDVDCAKLDRIVVPAPGRATAWLLAPLGDVGAEAGAELRQSLMRRLGAVLVSAVATLVIELLAVLHYPGPLLLGLLAIDVAVASVRIPLVIHMMQVEKRGTHGRTLRPWMVDLFILFGLAWSAILGVETLLWLRTGDPALMVLAALFAMGTIGAQGVRSPGTPRLNCVQMCLIVTPFMAGCALHPNPLMIRPVVVTPLYLSGMINITSQLHEDYVGMIVARIENRRRALHCSLTDLPNRAFFNEQLAAILPAAETAKSALAVLYLDLDGFKAVNDSRGHAVGDALLVQVGQRLEAWNRPVALAARLGGDEFAVLLRTSGIAQAQTQAALLIDVIGRPYEIGADAAVRIGASIGLATNGTAGSVAEILAQADQALYAAKRAGRGTAVVYDPAESADAAPATAGLHAAARRMRSFDAAGAARPRPTGQSSGA